MIILLLTILAIALCFIVAGLVLSPKSPARPARDVSYATRSGTGTMRRSSSPTLNKSAQVSRRMTYELERGSSWGNFAGVLNIGRIFRPRVGERASWMGLTFILIALFGFGLFSLRTLLPGSTMVVASSWPDVAAAATPPKSTTITKTQVDPFASLSGASKAIARVDQLSLTQYNSQQDYDNWAYSTCSAAAMTAVINSYGHSYRLADILKVEDSLHEITPELGLLEPLGIDRTVAKFGFQTYWLNNPTVDSLIKVANQGRPVIIGFPPALWSGGHILVVRGGTDQYVYLTDSSRLNMQTMTRSTFMKYWAGFAVVAMPKV